MLTRHLTNSSRLFLGKRLRDIFFFFFFVVSFIMLTFVLKNELRTKYEEKTISIVDVFSAGTHHHSCTRLG